MSRKHFLVCFAVILMATAASAQTLVPPIMQLLQNNSSTGGVDATVGPVAGATLYNVKVKDASGNIVATQTSSSTKFSFTGLKGNTQYFAVAQAQNSTSTSANSNTASVVTLPSPPTNISGIGGLQKVTISWAPVAGATSYQLTLSNGMSFVTSGTSFVVTGLQTATSYNLIMASINSAGQRGGFSSAVVVRTANVAM